MNKLLTVIFLISFVFYTVTNPVGGDNPLKWVVYSLMILLSLSNCFKPVYLDRYFRKIGIWFLGFTVFFLLQIIFAHERFINDFILWVAFLSLSMQVITVGVQSTIWKTLLFCMCIDYVVGIPRMALDLSSGGYAAGWCGMFQNPNTHSIFLCTCLISALLSCRDKKIRMIVVVVVLGGIIVTRSRNALLVYFLIVGSYMLEYKLKRFQKWFPLILVGVLIFAGYYMLVVEFSATSNDIELFGKSEGSAGRGQQLLYLTTQFDLKLWGNGRYINSLVENKIGYPVHNVFIVSFYVLGLLISLLYLGFIYWLYRKSYDYKFKVALLAVHFYFFFEPGYFFCVQMFYFLPMFVLCSNFWNKSVFNIIDGSNRNLTHCPKLIANL